MADEVQPIIKKVIKVEGHGHHGGAWKVAYADFVTAMMAFFLLLWLLNSTSEEQKRGISNYFGPPGELSGAGGSGGVLAGLTITSEGNLDADTTNGEGHTSGQQHGKKGFTDTEIEALNDNAKEETFAQDIARDGPDDALNSDDAIEKELEEIKKLTETEKKQLIAEQNDPVDALDKQNFEEVKEALKQSILQDPELKELAKHLIIDETPEGLRIQIVDQHNRSMFKIGDYQPLETTTKLLKLVAEVVKKLPNKISITGHTDARPFRRKNYGNWELSADRANAARRVMLSDGLAQSRMVYITGKAATEPFDAGTPTAAINRRISIILHRIVRSNNPTAINSTVSAEVSRENLEKNTPS